MAGRGGKREGAGRPGGFDQERVREELRKLIAGHIPDMTASQIAAAKGIKFLMVREKNSGKFVKVARDAAEKLDPEQEIIEVWEKDPSVQAYADLLNRTIGKPAETVEQTVKGALQISWKTSE
jgi:hypothetical protein